MLSEFFVCDHESGGRIFEAVAVAQSLSRDVAVAQIATAITTIFYSLVFVIGYYLVVKGTGRCCARCAGSTAPAGAPDHRTSGSRAVA
jgi:hypothetical protein